MKKNIITILVIVVFSISFISCDILLSLLDIEDSALFCILPSQIAEQIAPTSLNNGNDLDNTSDSSQDSNKDGELNSALFIAGIVSTAVSQGQDLFNSIISDLSNFKDLFEDEKFITYEKDGKFYGVNIKNASQTCYLTYGEVSAKEDTDYTNGDVLSQFIYDPREQDDGPNMSIVIDEYGLENTDKTNGARYFDVNITSTATDQTAIVKVFLEGDQAQFFDSIGGLLKFDKSTSIYEIEGLVRGYPLTDFSELNPKFRVIAVLDDTESGAVTASLEDFGISYTLGKGDFLAATNITEPELMKLIDVNYNFSASLDYQTRNYITIPEGAESITDVTINATALELSTATVKMESVDSSPDGWTSILPSGEYDFASVLNPFLGMSIEGESSMKFYENITENGNWKTFTLDETYLTTKDNFTDVID